MVLGSLIVSFDPADTATSNAFVAAYSMTNTVRLFGPYSGKLGNRSDSATLERPQVPDLPGDPYSWVVVDEIVYGNQTPWPSSAAGGGDALHRISLSQHGKDPANWTASAPTPGATDANNENGDVDEDGLPDDWESAHGLSPISSEGDDGADGDPDGDGMTNVEEWRAGTHPNQSSSVLKLLSIQSDASADHVILSYPAASNRVTMLESSLTLNGTNWSTIHVTLNPVSNLTQTATNSSANLTNTFFRLTVPVP